LKSLHEEKPLVSVSPPTQSISYNVISTATVAPCERCH
jgi:hypothetical protein